MTLPSTAIWSWLRARIPRTVLVFGLYFVFSVLNTLPLAFRFTTHIPGDGGDTYFYLWNLWLVGHSLGSGTNPMTTDLAFWPEGARLFVGTTALLEAFATLPVLLLGGPVCAYNLLVIAKPALNAVSGFALARYLWADEHAAVLGGLAFGFSAYVGARGLVHPALVDVAFVALAILFLFRLIETGRKRYYALFAVACFVNVAMVHYGLYLAVFISLFVAWQCVHFRPEPPTLRRLVRRVTVAGLLALAFSSPLVFLLLSQAEQVGDPTSLARAYGADLSAYFLPSPYHPLFGGLVRERFLAMASFGNLTEAVVFPGYAVLLLAAAVPILRPRRAATTANSTFDVGVGFWTFAALVFFVLSLGLELRIAGKATGVPLPYAVLNQLPFWRAQHAPSRWSVMTGLALAMLAAAAVQDIRRRRQAAGRGGWGSGLALAAGAIVIECAWAPYQTSPVPAPSPFYRQMADDRERYAVLDVPYGAARGASLLAQMVHGKPTIGGYAFGPANYLPDRMLPPFYDLNLYWPQFANDIVPFDLRRTASRALGAYGVRYVLVHRTELSEPYRDWAARLIGQTDLGPSVYRDDALEVYRVPDRGHDGPIVVLTRYFTPDGVPTRLEPPSLGKSGLAYREMSGDRATFGIWASQGAIADISLAAWASSDRSSLTLAIDDLELGTLALGADPQTLVLAVALRPGSHRLTLRGHAVLSRLAVDRTRPWTPP